MNTIWILLSIMYLSRVLTKFLIVGRAQHTKNQNHEYYLDCVIIFRAISTIWIVLELQTRAISTIGVCLFHKPEPCVLFGPVVLFSTEEYMG